MLLKGNRIVPLKCLRLLGVRLVCVCGRKNLRYILLLCCVVALLVGFSGCDAKEDTDDNKGELKQTVDVINNEFDSYDTLVEACDNEVDFIFPDEKCFGLLIPYEPSEYTIRDTYYKWCYPSGEVANSRRELSYLVNFVEPTNDLYAEQMCFGMLNGMRQQTVTEFVSNSSSLDAVFWTKYRGYEVCSALYSEEETEDSSANLLEGSFSYRIVCAFQYGESIWCGEWGVCLAGSDAALDSEVPKTAYLKLFILLDAALDKVGAESGDNPSLSAGESFIDGWAND